ncbi:MAG TPA: hypothetical protein VNG51_09905 [Ktedonobacteraceae bacterium]|nr:hypothetical protein [Ktedonobacteraceae bacterium]
MNTVYFKLCCVVTVSKTLLTRGKEIKSHRAWRVLDYADVANIQLRVWATSFPSDASRRSSTHFRLDIQKRNGEQQQ